MEKGIGGDRVSDEKRARRRRLMGSGVCSRRFQRLDARFDASATSLKSSWPVSVSVLSCAQSPIAAGVDRAKKKMAKGPRVVLQRGHSLVLDVFLLALLCLLSPDL